MARGVPLSTLRTRVQRAADIEGSTARFPSSELNDYINESLAELYGLIIGAYGQDYYRRTFTFTTNGASASYPLPNDFLSVISVDVPLGGNLVITAKTYSENERNLYKFFPFGAWTLHQPLFYRLTGAFDSSGSTPQTITFTPQPSGPYTVNVNYVPVPTKLVDDLNTFDGVAGWEEYVVLDAAMKCATKNQEWELLQALAARKQGMRERVEAMAAEHNAGTPERVQDIYRDIDNFEW